MQIKPYSIHGTGASRVLVVDFHKSKRLRFYEGNTLIKFTRKGGQLIAAVTKLVRVYRLPTERDFHKEYMQHSRVSQWLGSAQLSECYTGTLPIIADPERLVNNMLEFEEEL